MNILVIGNGGREHALAWKLAQSPRAARVWVAPGNGAAAAVPLASRQCPISNLQLSTTDPQPLVAFARQEEIGLTVVGPEAALAAGIVDAFQAAELPCFGPTRAAAQLETSKAFAKAFMARHGIPTGSYATFTEHAAARAHLRSVDYPVVIKASGLAAGKGVIVPESRGEAEYALSLLMVERAFGAAGDEVVIEERLYGQEASVLAFSDGRNVVPMPPAQDHKPVFDGDRGPNTGGMGAYAPAPLVTPALMDTILREILQPAVDGMRAAGTPYVGVLYAGLMIPALAPTGNSTVCKRGAGASVMDTRPKVLEFNCRFGDPETQVILPLLESDLVEVLEACLNGDLDRTAVRWQAGAAATVVAASEGYPGSYPKEREITGVSQASGLPGVTVFHAGTRRSGAGRLLTSGGRVLAVTGVGKDLPLAISRAYEGIAHIHFQGMHYRRDIGAKALPRDLHFSGKRSLWPVS
ncbi:MAG: phosphoribosylamine--glycine ligase [Chloroflexi bacterium HGW-Chloroflexi-1]|nr:MAG: phosphoribosylamine--glycine ligase [Chloroflexi bacterium HGW-Chloroflexi-1]